MANEALKPCPLCAGPADFIGSEVRGYEVQCKHCLAKGPWGDYGFQAEAAWNRRATLSSDDVAGGEPVVFLIERLVGPGYGPARSIVDAAKYDPTQDAFWLGDAKARHLVTPLYAAPPELDQLRDRVKELEKALDGLFSAERFSLHVGYENGNYVYADVIRVDDEEFRTARRVREGGKVDG